MTETRVSIMRTTNDEYLARHETEDDTYEREHDSAATHQLSTLALHNTRYSHARQRT